MDTLLITIGSFAGILVGAGLLLGCFIAIFVFVCSNESPERFFAIVWLVVFLLGLSLIISGAKSMRAIHPNHISSTTANTVVLSFFPKISTDFLELGRAFLPASLHRCRVRTISFRGYFTGILRIVSEDFRQSADFLLIVCTLQIFTQLKNRVLKDSQIFQHIAEFIDSKVFIFILFTVLRVIIHYY